MLLNASTPSFGPYDRKFIDTLELIIKKKTEEIVNKREKNKNQKAIALSRRRLLFGFYRRC